MTRNRAPLASRKVSAPRRKTSKRLSADVRERLIAREAVAFFAERGFEGQTRELAQRLGVTQPLLYRYFPSKKALIDRVYQEVYLNRWSPRWEEILDDHSRPLRERIVELYTDYAKAVLTYEWIRVFMFSGLKGMDLNARYISFVRDRIHMRVMREVRREYGLPTPAEVPISDLEDELVASLHASIFYIGIRKWIYGLPIPEDVDSVVEALALAFLDGAPKVAAELTKAASQRNGRRRTAQQR